MNTTKVLVLLGALAVCSVATGGDTQMTAEESPSSEIPGWSEFYDSIDDPIFLASSGETACERECVDMLEKRIRSCGPRGMPYWTICMWMANVLFHNCELDCLFPPEGDIADTLQSRAHGHC